MSLPLSNVYLIRHAHAGQRGSVERDIYRPLSDKGQAAAQVLATAMAAKNIGSVYASLATRCVQTVSPLAAQLGLEVVEAEELWEDSTPGDSLELINNLVAARPSQAIVLCSHANIIPPVVEMISNMGDFARRGRGCEKGSVWELSHDGNNWVSATYLGTEL